MRRRKANYATKEVYKLCIFETTNRLFNTDFTERDGADFIIFYHDLHNKQKQQIFDEMAVALEEDRKLVYKFFNNTFLPAIQPKLSDEIMHRIHAMAERSTLHALKGGMTRAEEVVENYVVQIKAALEFEDMYLFSAEYIHCKIRGALLVAFNRISKLNRQANKQRMLIDEVMEIISNGPK